MKKFFSSPERRQSSSLKLLQRREVIRHQARCRQFSEHEPEGEELAMARRLEDWYSCAEGGSSQNERANRYCDILPYDRTRVVVHGNRYLNANWVRERAGGQLWIAGQAPLPGTAHAFLTLALHSHTPKPEPSKPMPPVRTIVQLTKDVEGLLVKADPYFPTEIDQTIEIPPERGSRLPPYMVTLVSQEPVSSANCIRSVIRVETNGGRSILLRHLLYAHWPDHGVPHDDDIGSLVRFAQFADSDNRASVSPSLWSNPNGPSPSPDRPDGQEIPPILVGCSAGVGRTGAFLALCSVLRARGIIQPASPEHTAVGLPNSPLGPLPSPNDLVSCEIDSLREQRGGMVQREEQAKLVYRIFNQIKA